MEGRLCELREMVGTDVVWSVQAVVSPATGDEVIQLKLKELTCKMVWLHGTKTLHDVVYSLYKLATSGVGGEVYVKYIVSVLDAVWTKIIQTVPDVDPYYGDFDAEPEVLKRALQLVERELPELDARFVAQHPELAGGTDEGAGGAPGAPCDAEDATPPAATTLSRFKHRLLAEPRMCGDGCRHVALSVRELFAVADNLPNAIRWQHRSHLNAIVVDRRKDHVGTAYIDDYGEFGIKCQLCLWAYNAFAEWVRLVRRRGASLDVDVEAFFRRLFGEQDDLGRRIMYGDDGEDADADDAEDGEDDDDGGEDGDDADDGDDGDAEDADGEDADGEDADAPIEGMPYSTMVVESAADIPRLSEHEKVVLWVQECETDFDEVREMEYRDPDGPVWSTDEFKLPDGRHVLTMSFNDIIEDVVRKHGSKWLRRVVQRLIAVAENGVDFELHSIFLFDFFNILWQVAKDSESQDLREKLQVAEQKLRDLDEESRRWNRV